MRVYYPSNFLFGVSLAYSGGVGACGMFYSYDKSGGDYVFGLFPVVSLKSELISGNATDGFVVE